MSASSSPSQQPRQVLRLVRAVRVHLDHGLVTVVQGPAESGSVGHAETLLAIPVQDVDLVMELGQLVADLAGPVRTVVVDDQDLGFGCRRERALDDRLDVLGFVVGRVSRPPR